MRYEITYLDEKTAKLALIQEETIIDYIKHIRKNKKLDTIIRIEKLINSEIRINLYDPDELGGLEHRNMMFEFANYIYLSDMYGPNPISPKDILLMAVLYDPKFPV
jgi:hypothetical protein